MKALYARLSDSKFIIEDIPRPKAGKTPYSPEDVIVKVEYCGICGTELMLYRKGFPKGVINREKVGLGHEFSGIVEEVGSAVENIKKGDRVVGEVTTNPCGKCIFCQDGKNNFCPTAGAYMLEQGAYSEYLPIPAKNLHIIPDNVSLKSAAMCQPLSLSVNALKVVGKIKEGESIAIIGPGPIGLLMLILARYYGAGKIFVVGLTKDEKRLKLAKSLGADFIFTADKDDAQKEIKKQTNGFGADIVVEIAGAAEAVKSAFKIVRNCGRIVLTGAGYEPFEISLADEVMIRQLSVLGCRGDPTPCWNEAIDILATGKIDIEPIVSHILPLEKWEEGFKLSMSGESLKVLIKP
ncbi:MAG: hypothetical protein D6734_06095 [Candidatus Schekmanbacteria bacterium]|nr:MAG: hypothetical protein D6734_06095 [Candidatus Schekmanbacteria bacterium]